jgi:hypothetical protein
MSSPNGRAPRISSLLQEFRHALRRCRRLGFVFAAVLTLAPGQNACVSSTAMMHASGWIRRIAAMASMPPTTGSRMSTTRRQAGGAPEPNCAG